ncbi:MAG: UDP-N-acetylmuramate dehydrogenase [Patescibacteria group bacterium]
MLKIEKDHPLGQYTTIKVGTLADYFAIVKNKSELLEALAFSKKNKQPITVLGGGSNILFSQRIKGLVLKNEIKGIKVIEKNKTRVLVEALSGESWSKFVAFTANHKFYGLENLFLIYGTVGAAPVQNIGAYGVEFKDSFHHLLAFDLKTGQEKIFSAADCRFGYRDSVFKNKFKGRYFIYSVVVSLALKPNFQLDYGSIKEKLVEKGIKKITIRDIVNTIGEIRNSKLPNPQALPNSGSFFKNPEISRAQFKKLQQQYSEIPSFPGQANKIKIPAGWLIEQAGLKGKKFGPVRMYEKQALILVNEGGASAKQVLSLVTKVKAAVKKKFGLDLSEEVNII